MENKRKWILALLSLLLLAYLGSSVFGWYRLPFKKINPYEAVPYNSALVFEIKDWDKLPLALTKADYKDIIEVFPIVEKLQFNLPEIKNLIQSLDGLANNKNRPKVIAATQLSGQNDFELVYVLDGLKKDFELPTALKSLDGVKTKTSIFKGQQIYQIQNDSIALTLCHFKGLLLAGKKPYLVEYAVRQLKDFGSNIYRDKIFRKAVSLGGKEGDLTCMINVEQFPLFATTFIQPQVQHEIDQIKSIADWMSFDLHIQKETIMLAGYTFFPKNNKLLKALSKQKQPKEIKTYQIIPDHTALMVHFGFREFKRLVRELVPEEGEEFKKYFMPWIGEELAVVLTEPHADAFASNQFAVFQMDNQELAIELLDELASKKGELESYPYQNYTIRRMMVKDILKPILGDKFNTIQNPYWILLDEFVVMANSKTALELWIDKYNIGHTFGRNEAFLNFEENLSSTSNLQIYFDFRKLFQWYKSYVKVEKGRRIEESFERIQKLSPIGVQWSAHNNMLFTNGQIQFSETERMPTQVVWKTALKEEALIAPSLVKNHKTKEWEIFVQDKSHRVYLLNNGGQILWERKLEGPILSEIYQIDAYRNDKLQLLFNTKEYIYLIDRNGEDVKGKGYPKNVRNASNGLMVMDYSNDKDYRMFLATESGNIYGYKLNGSPLSGWNPNEGNGVINFPLQHALVDGKDYIFSQNNRGRLRIYDLDGTPRTNTVKLSGRFASPFGIDMISKPYRVVNVNEEAYAYITNLNGKFFNLKLKAGKRRKVKFAYSDVIEDERKEYIALSENEIVAYDHSEKILSHQFEENQSDLFTIKTKNSIKSRIGTLSRAKRRIYLLDENGLPYPNFPIAGTTPFVMEDLFGENKEVLVVANGNSIYAYRL